MRENERLKWREQASFGHSRIYKYDIGYKNTYTAAQKFGISKMLNVFF